MERKTDFHFVNVKRPGRKVEPEEDKALRSYVRHSVVRSIKQRSISQNLRLIEYDGSSRKKRVSKNQESQSDVLDSASPRSNVELGELASGLRPARLLSPVNPHRPVSTRSWTIAPAVHHPLTQLAKSCLQVSASRFDDLFTSNAFRTACEPTCDGSKLNGVLGMQSVFPGCLEEPVFAAALAYSVLQIANRGQTTPESLYLKGKTMAFLSNQLETTSSSVKPAVIGAIMLLTSSAYKLKDPSAHQIHRDGLTKVVSLCRESGLSLTDGTERALFWLDLFGSLLAGSERRLSHHVLPQTIVWQREHSPQRPQSIPAGFLHHYDQIPDSLLECVSDITELQSAYRELANICQEDENAHYKLDTMQASIESRLAFEGRACQQFGLVAQAIRYAALMSCYCSWMDVWNDDLIPSRLCEYLIQVLRESFNSQRAFESHWSRRIDLLLWLLLVGTGVAKSDTGHIYDLRSRQTSLIRTAITLLISLERDELPSMLHTALNEFLYCEGWLASRHENEAWALLERVLT